MLGFIEAYSKIRVIEDSVVVHKEVNSKSPSVIHLAMMEVKNALITNPF
jgi:hypothetical protein